ncbi:MAG: alpha-amylase [Bacteroidales bacterium]|nr:alpha-amylase [Bacteroidales bacterium]
MKRLFLILAILPLLAASCNKQPQPVSGKDDIEIPSYAAGEKQGKITYQLLIYSFADSNGDRIGDFNGIKAHLDYLDALGVSALWLSPAHPADSYHGYDVTDYGALNPKYGTEADFKALIDAAHAKGIKIYMDYVLNHSGKGNPWFLEALADESSPYRDWYFISGNPSADWRNYPMLSGYSYNKNEWHSATSGSPTLTISSTSDAVTTSGNASWNLWTWAPGKDGREVKFTSDGSGSYYSVMEVSGNTGFLVRKYSNWDAGSKFGAAEQDFTAAEGSPIRLVADGGDIFFNGSGRYRFDLTNVDTKTVYYMGAFGSWMPDFNYGNISQAENNPCFKALAATVDKWIGMGIDGLRLDAVKHICGGMNSFDNNNNVTFLGKWYDRCNATYRKTHSEDFYMVAECWMDASSVAQYYKALPANFEFDFWERLKWVLNQRTGCYFCKDLMAYRKLYAAQRSNAIAATKLTNHDETRAATILGRDIAKMKQAAAFLMTAEGEPYIYQGEELGYWGKDGDEGGRDELVRTPIVWESASNAATRYLGGHIDYDLVTDAISVKKQEEDAASLLHTYFKWTKARNSCKALWDGKMSAHSKYNDSNTSDNTIAAWYMTASSGEKALVLHNVGSADKTIDLPSDKLDNMVVSLGSVSVAGSSVTLGASSSVVFMQ